MDKYDDLGLEASKFIEDLNMYEASKDGLFRVKRDAENNPDFEETRKVFASKMTKIHIQKQQEEMARNSLAARINGSHSKVSDNTLYTKDRPPINSYRPGGEAAAKPPIMSGPMVGTASATPYISYEGQKHHSASLPDGPRNRAYDIKETGNAVNPIPVSAPSTSPPGTWASRSIYPSPTPSSSFSNSSSSSSSPGAGQNYSPVSQGFPQTGKSPSQSPTGTYRDAYHLPQKVSSIQLCQPVSAQWPASGPTYQNGVAHNIGTPSPIQVTQPPLSHGGKQGEPSHPKSPATGNPTVPTSTPIESPHDESSSPSRALKLPCHTLHVQTDQGPCAAEIKLEALTECLEKEMDAQPKAEYFGKHNVITAVCFSINIFHICNCV